MTQNPLAHLSGAERSAGTTAIAKAIPALAAASTVVIASSKNGLARQIGTGTLLAVADARFVVTAAHVVNEAIEAEFELQISTGKLSGRLLPLRDTWMVSLPIQGQGRDYLDVAVYRLTRAEAAALDTAD